MAESSLQDVALSTQSVGELSPSDAPAITTDKFSSEGDVEDEIRAKENGISYQDHVSKVDEQGLEDGGIRSDTDNSRANSVAGDARSVDNKPVKKFAVNKPVSFAKYSVPKTVTTAAPPKVSADKAPTPSAATMISSSTPLGRPRLVAKTTSASQQKLSAFKPAAPDPMQVWNKNRATPQQSTKHLTDEELKQQYGIHLTSRLQSDNEGKEAKWADIDDDEDDWAPETIEWNDGTKTTVNPADSVTSKQTPASADPSLDSAKSTATSKVPGHQYSSSVGPNATVLKIGANVERQQAQKALQQQSKGPNDRPTVLTSKASPAPAPVKSPWAKLPEIDKISPVAVNPVPATTSQNRFPPPTSQTPVPPGQASSPAKEMSADDFNRSWRNSPQSQNRELFMPSSGRYEAVADGKRRMSKNEQNFRAPAVLQRPNQRDTRAPAEPSAAFQTRRTSIDQGRRRASSSISNGSGQLARRMSFKSTDAPTFVQPDSVIQQPPSRDGPSPRLPTPTYQAHIRDPMSGNHEPGTEIDLEAQRAAQKALMKEKIEKARQRKLEEEQRLEAEKQERIKAKLASLGPPPEPVKPKQDDTAAEKQTETPNMSLTTPMSTAPIRSPPKPPQPSATGEPQQYGMMTVHPLESVKKLSPTDLHTAEPAKSTAETVNNTQQSSTDKPHLPSPIINGARPAPEAPKHPTEDMTTSESGSKFSKSANTIGGDARASWASTRNDHRPQPTNSLWGLPNNKMLGNGTFDQSLAGYSPQDLSRASSTPQGWMNGRTPTVGQSPQMNHVTQHVSETRSHLLQSMTSPDSQPLSLNSEVDSALPVSRPAPIGRPHVPTQPPAPQSSVNGLATNGPANGLAAWNNFQHVARAQERADNERYSRELSERREEEKRTGARQQAPYNFQETFKQVQLGDQAGQRHISNVAQTSQTPNTIFGAVGSLPAAESPSRVPGGSMGRGSRFFPQQMNGPVPPERRAATYSHSDVPRSPSPPPAEEYASFHPAFDGDYNHPKVHFPREKAVVRLPPAAPPPPEPVKEPVSPPRPQVPLTWAARVSMPAPVPPPVRAVSTPLVNNPSWQERFNGLFYGDKSAAPAVAATAATAAKLQPAPGFALSREPLDIVPAVPEASVSLPQAPESETAAVDDDQPASKDVEDEEDLFEDREAGSLPTIHLPREATALQYPLASLPRTIPAPIDPNSIHMFMVSNWSERYGSVKPQYAVIKVPGGGGKGVKRDLPVKSGSAVAPLRARTAYLPKHHTRPKPSVKPRSTSKAS